MANEKEAARLHLTHDCLNHAALLRHIEINQYVSKEGNVKGAEPRKRLTKICMGERHPLSDLPIHEEKPEVSILAL